MNRTFADLLLVVLAFVFTASLTSARHAQAAEPVVCSITTDATSKTTASPTTGTCTWVAGSTVLVACDQDIYLDSTTSTNGSTPTATSADQLLSFSSNKDPIPVYLEPRDKVIAVTQVTTAGTCKFMTVSTRRPR